MKNGKSKIILTAVLGLLVFTLFYFYVLYDTEYERTKVPDSSESKIMPLTSDKLQYDVDSILNTFGIKKDWIKESKIKEKDLKVSKDDLMILNDVVIPTDLQTIDLNYEITDHLRKFNLQTKVTEDPKTRNIIMDIVAVPDSTERLIGFLRFLYSDTVKRNGSDVCLVLDSLDEYGLDDVETILNSTQEYSVFLPLRNDKADYQSLIIEKNKDFLLKFSVGEDDDIEADFKESMKASLWKSKVRTAGISFPKVTAVILLNRIRNKEFYNKVMEEFTKYNIPVYSDSVFSSYRYSDNKISALFENIVNESKNGRHYLFYDVNFNPGEFNAYDNEVYKLKKLGYRFYNFWDLMNRKDGHHH